MSVEPLVESLLWEGYALYPYTPGAAKNATPTPFGIIYPPAYAAALDTTFDHLRVECIVEAKSAHAQLTGDVRFLISSGERHRARDERARMPSSTLEELACAERSAAFEFQGADGPIDVRLRASASPLHHGRARVLFWVENRTPVKPGLDRAQALRHSLLSTHPVLSIAGGRFVSPLEAPACASVNTFPVLAAPRDDVLLGATIMLPDHPEIAPESRGGLFDSTEIEEALLLHVQVLSDDEREAIAADDPTVHAMVDRAMTATPDDLLALHGRTTLRDPTRGEDSVEVNGRRFARGQKVVLRPGERADLHARMAAGRTATIEKLMVDYDGRVHVGVTIDGDPGQELLRETGRLMYFFEEELE